MNSKQITFKFREELSRKGEAIHRPIAEVFIKGRSGEWFRFYPYVDSGADINLFPRADCKLLGFNLKKGEAFEIGGVTGHTLKAYLHRLNFRIGNEEFEADVGFANSDKIPRLLGRKDILDYFTICLNGKQKETVFVKNS
jgi:hypothetical protein